METEEKKLYLKLINEMDSFRKENLELKVKLSELKNSHDKLQLQITNLLEKEHVSDLARDAKDVEEEKVNYVSENWEPRRPIQDDGYSNGEPMCFNDNGFFN